MSHSAVISDTGHAFAEMPVSLAQAGVYAVGRERKRRQGRKERTRTGRGEVGRFFLQPGQGINGISSCMRPGVVVSRRYCMGGCVQNCTCVKCVGEVEGVVRKRMRCVPM